MEKTLATIFNTQLEKYINQSASILLLVNKNSYDLNFWFNYFINCNITVVDVDSKLINNHFDIIFDYTVCDVNLYNKSDTIFKFWNNLSQGGYYIVVADILTENKVCELLYCLSTTKYMENYSTEVNTQLLYSVNNVNIHKTDNLLLALIEKKTYKNLDQVTNIFIITSVLQVVTQVSTFTREERFEQTKYTIETIREKVPNCFICFIDITELNSTEKEYFNNNVDMIVDCSKTDGIKNIVTTKKNSGEIAYTLYALDVLNNIVESSNIFKYEFKAFPKLQNIFKISGRYYLNSTFDYSKYDNQYNVIKLVESNLWFNKATSCFYKISKLFIQDYIKSLKESREFLKYNDDASYPCEHFIFLYVINYKSINANVDNLGVSGKIAVNGVLGHC